MKHLAFLRAACVPAAAFALLVLAACGSSSSAGSGPTYVDVHAPLFHGVRSAATPGARFVRLDWKAAQDEGGAAAVRYSIYASATSGGQDFTAPVLTTAAGETSAILDASATPLILPDTPVFFVVRATDGAGNQDLNTVEIRVTPVPAARVAFVSDTAGGAGTLGDASDPFPTIQDGVTAVEGAGGGVVLVDAAPGGTSYAVPAEISLTGAVTSIGIYGGFARFSSLGPAPTGSAILATRDFEANPTTISGSAAFPAQLINVANNLARTDIDGFTFNDTRPVAAALTGTLRFEQGQARVRGEGTLFNAELSNGDTIRLDADGLCAVVDFVSNDTLLFLRDVYEGTGGIGAGSRMGAHIRALTATDADLQFSCNRMLCGAQLHSDTTAITVASTLRAVGNEALGVGNHAFSVGGGFAMLRIQGNRTMRRGHAVEDNPTTTSEIAVQSTGTRIHISHNLFEHAYGASAGDMVQLGFIPGTPATGGALDILIEWNEWRDHSSDSVDLDDIAGVGDNGSTKLVFRNNLSNGASSDGIEASCFTGNPFPGVDTVIDVLDNDITNGDSICVDLTLGVPAGRSTRARIHDNVIAIGESEMIEVNDHEPGTNDVCDGGTLYLDIRRNVGLGGSEDLETEVGYTHGGMTQLNLVENTILSSEDEAMTPDLENQIGSTSQVYAFPSGIYCFNMFNNELEAHDDESCELEDGRDGNTTSIVVGYIGNNIVHNGADGSDGALDFRCQADDGGWLIERSVCGLGGSEGSEAGIEFDGGTFDTRNDILVRNCTVLLASGGGFEMDTDSSQVQLINCTAAYNGINQNDNAGFENDQWNGPGDGQVYILNCIGSHTGGENGDFDRRGGFRPTYSLARDATGPWGLGNQWGEPFYRSSVTDLPFPISNQLLGTLFQLRPGSAAVDAGHPAAKWNDTDGTRNDMGAFGGPDAGVIGTLESGLEIPFVHVATFPSPNLPSGSVLLEDTDTIWLGFTVPVSATLLSQIQIRNDGVDVPGTMSLVGGGHLVQFVPDTVLTPGASDFVEVTIGAGLRSAAGALINRGSSFRFAVQPSTPIAEGVNDDTVAGLTAADLAAAQVIGNGAAPAVFDVNGTLDVTTDDDVYAITVEAGDRLMATTIDDRNGGGTNGQIHLNLYDANFGLITEGRRGIFRENNAGDTYVDHTFETAGTYYLVVNNRSLGAALPYILRAVLDN